MPKNRIFKFDDGTELPNRIYFKNTKWDENTLTFTGV